MTAVEWLVEILELSNISNQYQAEIEQAKEMEKQQIIDAYGDEQSHLQDDGSWRTVTSKQYYNEKFNK